jgi:hypothetical protein
VVLVVAFTPDLEVVLTQVPAVALTQVLAVVPTQVPAVALTQVPAAGHTLGRAGLAIPGLVVVAMMNGTAPLPIVSRSGMALL